MDSNADPTTYRHIDLGVWPENQPCSGQTSHGNVFKFMNSLLNNY